MDALVTNGTITQDQKTAIENALKPSGGQKGQGRNFGQNFKTKLDALVTAGTITTAEESSVISALQSNRGSNLRAIGSGAGYAPNHHPGPRNSNFK